MIPRSGEVGSSTPEGEPGSGKFIVTDEFNGAVREECIMDDCYEGVEY